MGLPNFSNLGEIICLDLDQTKIGLIDLGGESGPREYTYAQIDQHCNAVARRLSGLGFKSGERIAILSANRAEFIFTYLGIMRAGLVAVPVNFKFPPALIEFVIRDADAQLVFCDTKRSEDVPDGVTKVNFDDPGPKGFNSFLDFGEFVAVKPESDQVAMFLYTSGSTGKPKGVRLSHQSHLWVAKNRIGKNDWSDHRFLVAAPLYHMNALALIKLSLMAHASIVLLPQFTAKSYLEAIQQYQCTWLTAVPPMIAMMLQEKELIQKTDFSSVQYLRMGSAPVSSSLLKSIKEVLPQVLVTNAYGTTEGGPVVFGPHPEGLEQPPLSVGYPHPDVQLRLVNEVLELKSPGLMLGYHKALTRVPALKSPFTEDGFYVTGDMFRVDENGFYSFIGRSDDMFVSGGENIYPSEVERLLESHPLVQQAAVVPVEDEIKGYKPAAFVVIKPGNLLSSDSLKQYCLKHAPAYQHPRWIWFLNELPLASTNKIDKARLLEEAKSLALSTQN
jgi:acyl-CoA synthetase (AMP-forming)/AMP-acid ligase II